MNNLFTMLLLMCSASLFGQTDNLKDIFAIGNFIPDTCLNCPIAMQQSISLISDSSMLYLSQSKRIENFDTKKPVNIYVGVTTKEGDIIQIWIDEKLIFEKLQ